MKTRSALGATWVVGVVLLAGDLDAVQAQESDPAILTLDRLHDGDEFRVEGYGPVRWLEDGRGYTSLEDAEGGGRDIVLHDPESGRQEILVPASRLVPEGASEPLAIADYVWSAAGDRLLVFTNTRRVWRYNTRGDYWVLDLPSGRLHRLGQELEQTWLQFAKFAPDGRSVAYVHHGDLYVEEVASGSIRRLTTRESDEVIHGTFDWVYEEEWSLRDGFRWSPDGSRIAFWQIRTDGVRRFTLVDYTSGLYPKLTTFPYPKVGETNPAARVGVVEVESGAIRWLNLPGNLRDDYVARMEWAASSDEVVVQRVNRLQNTIRVLLGDASTGSVREILREQDEAWAEVCDDLRWLDGGRSFTWVSERDGWRHLYLVPREGGPPVCVTPGDHDVVRVIHVDEEGGLVYLIASPDDPTRRFLYRVPLAGGPPQRITPADAVGTHDYQISRDARWAIHTVSSFGVPPAIELVRLPSHETVRTLVDNATLNGTLEALARGPAGFFRVDIGDGVELDGWYLRPPDFDPSHEYPLLVHVYGEPAGQTVLDRWGGRNYLWHLLLAQRGYVVVSFDNRGTPAPRGRAWRKSIYRQIGILASADQAAALRALQERWSFLDRDRVGIWGWSGGGSMSLNAIFRHPELYHTAIAVAFVANQRYYDTIYQERYMGLPDGNPDGFRDGSPITFAHQLEGNLLLVYGTGDDNCHYQNCEALVNELVEHGKRFSMMAYPNRSHGIHEGENTRKHLYTTMTDYLLRNLPPGPTDR